MGFDSPMHKEYELEANYRAGRIHISYKCYDESADEEYYDFLFTGNYKQKKDKFIISNISYSENIGINEDKLIFTKQQSCRIIEDMGYFSEVWAEEIKTLKNDRNLFHIKIEIERR